MMLRSLRRRDLVTGEQRHVDAAVGSDQREQARFALASLLWRRCLDPSFEGGWVVRFESFANPPGQW